VDFTSCKAVFDTGRRFSRHPRGITHQKGKSGWVSKYSVELGPENCSWPWRRRMAERANTTAHGLTCSHPLYSICVLDLGCRLRACALCHTHFPGRADAGWVTASTCRGAPRRRGWAKRPRTLTGIGGRQLFGPRKQPNQVGWCLMLRRCTWRAPVSLSLAPPARAGRRHARSTSTTQSGHARACGNRPRFYLRHASAKSVTRCQMHVHYAAARAACEKRDQNAVGPIRPDADQSRAARPGCPAPISTATAASPSDPTPSLGIRISPPPPPPPPCPAAIADGDLHSHGALASHARRVWRPL